MGEVVALCWEGLVGGTAQGFPALLSLSQGCRCIWGLRALGGFPIWGPNVGKDQPELPFKEELLPREAFEAAIVAGSTLGASLARGLLGREVLGET